MKTKMNYVVAVILCCILFVGVSPVSAASSESRVLSEKERVLDRKHTVEHNGITETDFVVTKKTVKEEVSLSKPSNKSKAKKIAPHATSNIEHELDMETGVYTETLTTTSVVIKEKYTKGSSKMIKTTITTTTRQTTYTKFIVDNPIPGLVVAF